MSEEGRAGGASRSVSGGTVLLSSAQRGWRDVEVLRVRYSTSGGSAPAFVAPVFYLNLGPTLEFEVEAGKARHRGSAGAGVAAIVPAGLAPEWRWRGRGRLENLHVYLRPGLMEGVAEAAGVNPAGLEVAWRPGVRDPRLDRIGRLLLSEAESGGLGGELYAEGLSQAMAVHLLRYHSSLGRAAERKIERGPKGAPPQRALERAKEYVDDNLSKDLSLAGIAAAANLSERQLSRLFGEATGLSPHQYVIRERVEKAKGLLASTDLPVGEVALLCGFAHQGHLARHFGRFVGTTPARFRRESRR